MSVSEEPLLTANKDIKRIRAGHLAYATRKLNEFNEAHLIGDKEKQISILDSLKQAFKCFVTAHKEYIESGPQDEDLTRANEQYSELMNEILKADRLVSQPPNSIF